MGAEISDLRFQIADLRRVSRQICNLKSQIVKSLCASAVNPAARGVGCMFPLEGVRVVALEQAVAAPLCTRHLADLGADVVKVERPEGGDFARRYDSVVQGQSAYF